MSDGGICVRGSVLDKCLAKARTADRRPGQVGGLASLVAQSRASLVVMIVAPFCSMSATKRESSRRSEEHTSELQSLMRISYAVLCLKKKKNITESKYMHNIHRLCMC